MDDYLVLLTKCLAKADLGHSLSPAVFADHHSIECPAISLLKVSVSSVSVIARSSKI